jgi:pimeloyl-ACP methyl ester carboxylesterase
MTEPTIKKPLVFVHGYLGGSPQWASQVVYFSDEFNVITPGLPGFGLNAHLEAPETITGFAQYVLGELDKQDIEEFYLVGHSMGGMIAQEITKLASSRVEKLVLYGTGPVGEMPGRFETIAESRNRVAADGVESTARRISAKWFIGGESGTGYEGCAEIAVMASLQAAQAGLAAMESWSGVEALPNIKPQTLVLWGDKDKSYHWPLPEKLWKEIPDASLSVVAGCSHAVHLEKPHLFNAILRDFLNT